MVYILLGNGFEEIEAIAPCDILRRAGIQVQLVGLNGSIIQGGHNICVQADLTPEQMDYTKMEMIVLPGGMGGVNSILACEEALAAVKFAWENGRFVAAICAGPTILAALGITGGRRATCYPGLEDRMGDAVMQPDVPTVADGKLLTGTGPGTALDFGLMLAAALKGSACAELVKSGLVYHLARP